MPVRKAVIPAAGLGTRTLPASKAVPKVLIPVVDRPAIQYAVEEIVRAGISNICIVLSRGQESVGDHFTADPELEAALGAKGREEVLEEVRRLHHLADIFYVRQQEPRGLGHAVWTAREHVGDEPFAVVLPDEIYD
ncbi:MAG: sugar phosphate nucleotidyltransferase, partial [Gaiellales bacterium]